MARTIRSFIAVELSDAVRAKAAALGDALRAAGADVRWVDPRNLHLTLQFLGDVPESDVAAVGRAVGEAAAGMAPFELELRGAGAFPSPGRARTVWLGAARGTQEIVALHDRIERALKPLGFRPEGRKYQPHLTIGRVKRAGPALRRLGALIDENADFDAGRCTVREAVVFSSDLKPSGPVYQALAKAPLGGGE